MYVRSFCVGTPSQEFKFEVWTHGFYVAMCIKTPFDKALSLAQLPVVYSEHARAVSDSITFQYKLT